MRLILRGHQVSRNRSKAVAMMAALTTSLLVSLLIQSASATIGTNYSRPTWQVLLQMHSSILGASITENAPHSSPGG